MIDIRKEEPISLHEAANRLPKRPGGRAVHISTIYRWAQRGLKGVRLETIQVGGTRCTSMDALGRFFVRLDQQGCKAGIG